MKANNKPTQTPPSKTKEYIRRYNQRRRMGHSRHGSKYVDIVMNYAFGCGSRTTPMLGDNAV